MTSSDRHGAGAREERSFTRGADFVPRDTTNGNVGGRPSERKKLALAPRSRPLSEGDGSDGARHVSGAGASAPTSSSKLNPFGSAKPRVGKPEDYLTKHGGVEGDASCGSGSGSRPIKMKSNPFGGAKPVAVKYSDLDKAPTTADKGAAGTQVGDADPAPVPFPVPVDTPLEALHIS